MHLGSKYPKFIVGWALFLVLFWTSGSDTAFAAGPLSGSAIAVSWNVPGAFPAQRDLKAWSGDALQKLKLVQSREKDPQTGKLSQWQGVLLSQLIEQSIETLPPEQKAQIDLVVLKNKAGASVMVPRSIIVKYPVLLAFKQDGKPLTANAPAQVVLPWTSQPKITNEEVPFETFFVSQLTQIELSNYRARYADLFLKRRTDPAAMRGEKIFIQTCVGCHAMGKGPTVAELSTEPGQTKARSLASGDHPAAAGLPKFQDRQKKALTSYLEAVRQEQGTRAAL